MSAQEIVECIGIGVLFAGPIGFIIGAALTAYAVSGRSAQLDEWSKRLTRAQFLGILPEPVPVSLALSVRHRDAGFC